MKFEFLLRSELLKTKLKKDALMTEIGFLEFELKSKRKELASQQKIKSGNNNNNNNSNSTNQNVTNTTAHELASNNSVNYCPYSNNGIIIPITNSTELFKNCSLSENFNQIPQFSSDEVNSILCFLFCF